MKVYPKRFLTHILRCFGKRPTQLIAQPGFAPRAAREAACVPSRRGMTDVASAAAQLSKLSL
eukprot:2601789-Prymnesium_polylepis.1